MQPCVGYQLHGFWVSFSLSERAKGKHGHIGRRLARKAFLCRMCKGSTFLAVMLFKAVQQTMKLTERVIYSMGNKVHVRIHFGTPATCQFHAPSLCAQFQAWNNGLSLAARCRLYHMPFPAHDLRMYWKWPVSRIREGGRANTFSRTCGGCSELKRSGTRTWHKGMSSSAASHMR